MASAARVNCARSCASTEGSGGGIGCGARPGSTPTVPPVNRAVGFGVVEHAGIAEVAGDGFLDLLVWIRPAT